VKLLSLLAAAAMAATALATAGAATAAPTVTTVHSCAAKPAPGYAACTALRRTDAGAKSFGPKADTQVQVYFPFAFCSDWKFNLPDAASVAAQRRIDNKIAPVLRVSGIGWGAAMDCLGVTKVANPQHRYHVHGTPPILIVGGQHDPATPYAWSVDAARQIPAATLLTYDGWGHGQYDKSPCVVNAVDSYLISQTMPAKGTHCPAVPPASGFGPQHSMVSHNGF